MNVAIVDAGAIAKGYAVYLANRGHLVSLWSPSGRPLGGTVKATGSLAGDFAVRAATSAEDSVAGAEIIVVAVPASGHASVIDV